MAAMHLRAVGVQAVEGAGGDQIFEDAAVDELRVHAAGEIEEAAELAARLAHGDDMFHRRAPDIADRRQRVVDDVACRPRACSAVNSAPDALMSGGATAMPSRSASWRKIERRSGEPISSVIEAQKNSTG